MRKVANFWKYFIYAAMKVLFLTPWYPDERSPNHGVFIYDQVRAIAKQHEVHVISAKIDYSHFGLSSLHKEEHEMLGVKETRILIKRSLPVINQINYFVRVLLCTLKIARKFKPDIIHGNIGYPGAFWAWASGRFLKIPFLVTEHTRLVNNFRSRFHKFLTLYALKRASALIAVSQWHAEEITALSGIKAEVIPNIVDFKKYPAVFSKPAGKFQIGFLGGLDTPVKGLDMLLCACAMLQDDFKLHIGGKGALLEHYKKQALELNIHEKCIFYGFVQHDDVPAFMARLHFFVSASRSETFGIALVEAIACGLPVVATNSGGPRDYITPQNGILVDADAKGLAEGMVNAMRNFQRYDPLVIRNTVINKFSDDHFLRGIDKVYSRLLKT